MVVFSDRWLSLHEFLQVVDGNDTINIADDLMHKLQRSRELLLKKAAEGQPIYGCNTGVGWNKDTVVDKHFLEDFNRGLLYSHAVALKPYLTPRETRAAMLARLRTLLAGHSGVSPEVVTQLAGMLNQGIYPLIPQRGSVGEADIGCLSFLGLGMLGEGEVYYRSDVVLASEALQRAGMQPLRLGAKDALSIISSNAVSAGLAALLLQEACNLLKAANLVYCLSLEALDGNVSQVDEVIHRLRGYGTQTEVAAEMSRHLRGSGLYQYHPQRPLQDPLCYRNAPQVHGVVLYTLRGAEELLTVQLNATEDNPCVDTGTGTVRSCANFEPLIWVLEMEKLAVAFSHLSKLSCSRMLRLGNPEFTGLRRNLAPELPVHAFSTLPKTYSALDTQIAQLAVPISTNRFALSGDMEDHGTNAVQVVRNVQQIVRHLGYILASELLLSAQAVDMRKNSRLGEATGELYRQFRERVPFYSRDERPVAEYLESAHAFLQDYAGLS